MIRREITTERDLVPTRTIDTARSDLRGSCFARDTNRFRMNRFTRSLLHDTQQHIPHQGQGLCRANRRLDHLGREGLHRLTILHNLLGEQRTHHLAPIGDSVIESKRTDWRNLRLVADAHP